MRVSADSRGPEGTVFPDLKLASLSSLCCLRSGVRFSSFLPKAAFISVLPACFVAETPFSSGPSNPESPSPLSCRLPMSGSAGRESGRNPFKPFVLKPFQ